MFGKSAKSSLQKKTSDRGQVLWRILLISGRLALVALIVYGGLYAFDYACYSPQAEVYFGLSQIHYEGLAKLDGQALDSLIRRTVPKNVLLIDLDRLRGLVESESWVKTARIRRKLPNQLYIYVVERQPTAVATIDSELYVVDEEGVVLEHHGPRHQSIDRPIVKGLQNVARENATAENSRRMQIYLQVLNALQTYNHSISEIDVEDPERVAVVPEGDPVSIYLGKEHFFSRYETFISQKDLYKRLKEQYGTIESVDMTYDNKIIFHTPQEKGGTITAESGQQS